ncbi:MAG: LysR family transcriptional regulator [Firmicutes bacterium]|nr:LysR family transcriptional regulator [Bacillota bacterium]
MTNFEIEAFFAIIKTGSITKASDLLSITQSALSRRIHILELELGYPLFIRQRGMKNTVLTPQGKAFIPLAERWQELYSEMIALRSHKERRELRVAAPDSLNSSIFTDLYTSFMKQYPEIMLSIITARSDESYRYMEEGFLDIAYVGIPRYSKTVKCQPVFTEALTFVCGKESDYPETVNPKELKKSDCIMFRFGVEADGWYNHWFPNESTSYASIDKLSFLSGNMFVKNTWSIIPYNLVKSISPYIDIETRFLENSPPERCLYCITKENSPNNDIAEKFFKFANSYIKENYEVRFLIY